MITWFAQAALLAFACVSFSLLVLVVARSAMAGAGVVIVAFLLFAATSPQLLHAYTVSLGGATVYPLDVTSLALLIVGVGRLFAGDIYGPAKLALATVVLFLLASLVWGSVEFGVEQATNYARLWMLPISGLIYGATARGWDRRLPTVFIATGCFLAALGILQILRRGLHEAETQILIDGRPVDARPVVAMGVLVMLQALILLLSRGRFTYVTAGLALLLASGIVLVQFRTLWLAAIAALSLGGFFVSTRYRASNERLAYALIGVALLVVPMLLFAASHVGTYQESFRSTTGNQSTLTWRVGAWRELLERHSSMSDLVFGTPSGTDRYTVVLGVATDRSAHNMYVEALVSFGLIGFLAFCALAILALSHRRECAGMLEIPASAVLVLLACSAIVVLTNQPDQVQGLLFGAVLSAACHQTQRSKGDARVPTRTTDRRRVAVT